MKTPVKIAIAAGVVAVATPVVWLGWQILAGLHAAGPVAVLAVGARDHDGPDAFRAVAGEDTSGGRRLVVGVGVDGQQRQCHGRQFIRPSK